MDKSNQSFTSSQLSTNEIAALFIQANSGEKNALDQLTKLLYAELKQMASSKRYSFKNNHTLNTTALVNEAWLKLKINDTDYVSKKHFLSVAALAIRQILLDEVKRKKRIKVPNIISQEYDSNSPHQTIDDEAQWLYQLDQILIKLEKHSPRLVQVFNLKFFCGLTLNEIANHFEVSPKTAQRDWEKAQSIIQNTFNLLDKN